MKTYALILQILMSDGSQHRFVEDYSLSAADCVDYLVEGLEHPPELRVPFKGARRIAETALICEEETHG